MCLVRRSVRDLAIPVSFKDWVSATLKKLNTEMCMCRTNVCIGTFIFCVTLFGSFLYSCSMDEELFPNFQHMSAGDIASTFRAFQPTNLHGESEVDVAFTCNVAVCKGLCQKVVH